MNHQGDANRLFAPGGLVRLALRVAVAGTLLVLVFRMALPETEAAIEEAITGLFPFDFDQPQPRSLAARR